MLRKNSSPKKKLVQSNLHRSWLREKIKNTYPNFKQIKLLGKGAFG